MMTRITDIGQLRTLLVSYRRSAGLTQADVALRLGVTKARISQIETAPERVTTEQLFDVLRVIGVVVSIGPRESAMPEPRESSAAAAW
jgi:HTH-type transcriptional regulator/antitoxin HipB